MPTENLGFGSNTGGASGSALSVPQKWLDETDTIRVWTNYIPRAVKKYFAVRKLGKAGCTSQTCTHFSHDPSAFIYLLTPIQPVVLIKNTVSQETRELLFYDTRDNELILIVEEDLKGRFWDKIFVPEQ